MPKPPSRGEVWYVKLPTDPADKAARPVIVVSDDSRNHHPKAETVLVVPLTTMIHREVPTHIYLSPGETGLQEQSSARAEDITTIRKRSLEEPKARLRRLSHSRVCELADKVKIAMGCY
jgi:mRNA-degrading endonuclease toxin of MazEF toxin-antitoxin module